MASITAEMIKSVSTFGIEIEMTGIRRSSAANAIARVFGSTHNDVQYIGNGHYDERRIRDTDGRAWKVVHDGSIRAERISRDDGSITYAEVLRRCELVSPILIYKDLPLLKKVLEALQDRGAFVNDSCGIHVHVGGEKFTAEKLTNLINLMVSKENLLFRALKVLDSRKRYCKFLNPEFVANLNNQKPKCLDEVGALWYKESIEEYKTSRKSHYDRSRYVHTNLHSFFNGHGTVEFRCFNSTLDFKYVKSYIQFCLAVVVQALNATRASSIKNITNNDKFQMRNWLRKMGLNGDEFDDCRKVFMENLTGNTQNRF